MKDLIASIMIVVIMIGSALWVRDDTEKLARERFVYNAAMAYREVMKK